MTFTGHGVGSGIGVGTVLRMPEPLAEPPDTPLTGDAAAEMARVRKAALTVSEALDELAESLEGDSAEIVAAASVMAQDPALLDRADTLIRTGKTAERAIFVAANEYRDIIAQMEGYIAERASDVDDIAQKIRAELLGLPTPGIPKTSTPFVLAARALSPADTAALDFGLIKGIVTEEGGPTSHSAIIARAHGIPAVVGAPDAHTLRDGDKVIVRPKNDLVLTNPTSEEIDAARRDIEERRAVLSAPMRPGAMRCGTPVQLLANLGSLQEIENAKHFGAEGVGLFRTEFMFMGLNQAPSVDDQVRVLRTLGKAFPEQHVVIRLLDAGADKPLPYLPTPAEDNPALGTRGFRALRNHPEILESQLRAVQVASQSSPADFWVMAPMIADATEAQEFYDVACAYGLKNVGVMAEVPSLAILADQVTETVDFLSIGTNDLAQYALAADRLNGQVANYLDPWHPAVLRLIGMLGDSSHDAHIPLSVCGEAAADSELAPILAGLGATSLSMTPASMPEVRAALRSVSFEEATRRAKRACTARNAAQARLFGVS